MTELNGHIGALVEVYIDMYKKTKHEIYSDFTKYTIEKMRELGYNTYKYEVEYMYALREVRNVPIHFKDEKEIN